MKNKDGWDILVSKIEKVENQNDGYTVTDHTGWSTFIDKKYETIPKVGDILTIYTSNFSLIHGITINKTRLWYETKKEAEEKRRKQVEKENQKRLTHLEAERKERDSRRTSLPTPFQQRLNKFENNNPNWRRDYETYELFVCEQAVSLAELPKDKPIAEWYKWFRLLGYEKQKEVWPDLSDQHSGNTFGFTELLAELYESKKFNWIVDYHGALTPLVGCAEYGCHK